MPVVFYDHQLAAIAWMARVENRRRFVPEQPQGGILAHAMGLGKTASMLGWIDQSGARLTLVICPKSVLQQWREEALKVTRMRPDEIVVYHGFHRSDVLELRGQARLMLTTFDIVRLDHGIYENKKKQMNTVFDTAWDRIVVDEAHHICEQGSKTAKAIRSLRSPNRWCITGTPFKNGVSDLVALAKFLCVTPYNDPGWWRVYSKNKVKLREWREMFLNLQGKEVLDLPSVTLHMENCVETDADVHLLGALDDVTLLRVAPEDLSMTWLNSLETTAPKHELLKILRLRQLANHPLMLVPTPCAEFLCERATTISSAWQGGLDRGGSRVVGFESRDDCLMTLDESSRMTSECGLTEADPEAAASPETAAAALVGACSCCALGFVPMSNVTEGSLLCSRHVMCKTCVSQNIMCPKCLVEPMQHEQGWIHSSKTRALWQYVRRYPNDKMVLFSQWTTCLDLLAIMFSTKGVLYTRYDGRVNSLDERTEIIKHFRESDSCRILLTSLGAGGEGLNLTCATHVILMEPYWNCAVEQQAIDRVHRIGQLFPVHVLRLIMQSRSSDSNSVEQWVLDIQQYKTRELQRLLWGEEPVGPAKYIARNGNAQMRTGDSQPSVKMKFNESHVDSLYMQESNAGNLVRFLRRRITK